MKTAKIKKLNVETPEGHAGTLTKESRYVFNYETTTRDAEVSLVMPLRAQSFASGGLFSIFEMNRPEGYLQSTGATVELSAALYFAASDSQQTT